MKKTVPVAILLITLIVSFLPVSVSADYGDTTPPTSSISCLPSSPDGDNGWYVTPLSCTISADDLESGTQSIWWRLDGDLWGSQSFPPSLNLVSNSSFEEGDGLSQIGFWESVGLADFYHDSSTYFDGSYSASVISSVNGWAYWGNRTNYVVASPWQNLSASVWVKTDSVLGEGVYFKIYALTDSGEVLLTQSAPSLVETNDWTRLSADFLVAEETAYGVFLQLGLDGVGTVWYDAVTVKQIPGDTSVDLLLAEEGSHTLEYYAVDHETNEETPHNFFSYRLDATPPGNWRDFDVFRIWGAEHELYSVITVSDTVSGLQPFTDAFQYSVDAGEHWGYYSNLLSCNSTWNEGGWRSLFSVFPFPGVTDLLLITPKIDYCNSNWAVCKIIRFRVFDMAGNMAETDVCINGAWVQISSGLVGSRADIEMNAHGSDANTSDLIHAGGAYISNFTSSEGWVLRNYAMDSPWGYDDWLNYLPDRTLVTTLPTTDGIYIISGSYDISTSTLPSEWSSSSLSLVVFIDGDLRIRDDVRLNSEGAVAFIISGDLLVAGSVENVDGFYIVNGNFNSSYNGGNNRPPLTVTGGVVADSFLLPRSLSDYDNITLPAETFVSNPKYYDLLRFYLGGGNAVFWQEL